MAKTFSTAAASSSWTAFATVFTFICAAVGAAVFIVALVVASMYSRGAVYRASKHSSCRLRPPTPEEERDAAFCDIALLSLHVPSDLRRQLLAYVADGNHGKRVTIPGWKAGRTVPTSELASRVPDAIAFYRGAARHAAEQKTGAALATTDLKYPTSAALIMYDRANDFINWHYDVNHFRGRFFTMLVPLTPDDTCTQFQFRDGREGGRTVGVRVQPGGAILFEGDRVFHMASKQCAEQQRCVLSMQFATDARLQGRGQKWWMQLKDKAYV